MLILGRKNNERVFIDGGRIVITVVETRDGKVRLGIEAAGDVRIDREEIHIKRNNSVPKVSVSP